MNQKQKLEHYKKKAEEFRDAYWRLLVETKKLQTTLGDISVGLVNDKTKSNGWSHQTRLQFDAAEALIKFEYVHEPKGTFYV